MAIHASDSLLRSFSVADFAQYSPRTALDIVNRISGFSIEEEDDARGFGQASANVLVNGARIAGKSNGVEDTLQRIPIDSVTRIDVHEGARFGLPGLSGEIVDVIVDVDSFSGAWRWELQHRDQNDQVDPAYWKANVSMTGQSGDTTWTLGLDNDYQRLGHGGPETVFDRAGNAVEFRDEYNTFDRDRASIALGLSFDPATGDAGNLNIKYERYWNGAIETRESDVIGLDQFFRTAVNDKTAEFSGDYAFDITGGRLKLIAFHSFSDLPNNAVRVQGEGQLFDTLFASSTGDDQQSESIVRAEYNWRDRQLHEWQYSFEGAYNFIDRQRAIRSIDPGRNQDVDANVEERRIETNISYSRPLSRRLSLQSSLGFEYSELEQSGDVKQSRDFSRAKGFVALAYQAGKQSQLGLKLERLVGQLQFSDFIASVDLSNGTANASNPDLEPQQSWLIELTADQNFNRWGAATLTLFFEDIDDIVERIPVGNSDAVGNLDSARRYGAELVAAIEFAPLGWRGARLEFDGILQRSELDDPITGESRRINDEIIHQYNVELRHDVAGTDWAWGLGYEAELKAPTFRINQISNTTENRGLFFPFVEHKNLFGLTAQFRIRNFDDQTDTEERQFFDGRRDGTLQTRLLRRRDFGRIYILTLSGTF